MKKKAFIFTPLLLGLSLACFSGCNCRGGCDVPCCEDWYEELDDEDKIEVIIYNEDLSNELYRVTTWDNPSLSLSTNTTYILNIFINDEEYIVPLLEYRTTSIYYYGYYVNEFKLYEDHANTIDNSALFYKFVRETESKESDESPALTWIVIEIDVYPTNYHYSFLYLCLSFDSE